MTTLTVNRKAYDLMKKMDMRLQKIEAEVKEIKTEVGLEVRPEYLKKLETISKEKGRTFNSKEDFLNHLKQM